MQHHCYLFIGPSGSGKTTLANALFAKDQKIISYTTRPIRPGEQEGVDYYFVTNDCFTQMIADQKFAEYDCYGTSYYGVAKETLEEKLAEADCYDALTPTGFWNLRKKYGSSVIPVFLTVSKETIIERLHLREESRTEIDKRVLLFENDLKEKEAIKSIPEAIFLDAEKPVEELKNDFLNQLPKQSKI
ncbi:guanylate kinase [Enterococcus sp. JM4C]|uniref:guanylate kinase n=1 Tax=Candidatus Enterococcus huntleyi TaxID=1857217 RepID=UPI001379F287|nr:guanylate kinase [Enterococcus sp. JM4C]KAF1296917.1 guanylate kinase [Enterococcus sp. JM4C]